MDMLYRKVKSTYTLRRSNLGLLLLQLLCCCSFVWLQVELRKPSCFLEVRGQFANVTFRYHIMNSGFGDFKLFNTNILVKLAIAKLWFGVSSSRLHFGRIEYSARPMLYLIEVS